MIEKIKKESASTTIEPRPDSSPRLRMRMAHKAFILVAVPLVFQFIFVSVLGFLLWEVERNAKHIEGSRNLVLETENLQRMFYDAGAALAGYNVTKNPLFSAQFDSAKARIKLQLALISRLASREHQEKFEAKRVETLINQEIKLLDRLLDQIERDSLIGANAYEKVQDVSIRLSGTFERIIDRERDLAGDGPDNERKLRHLVEQWLWIGFCLNIVLVLGLAAYFNRGTVGRLKILMQNTSKIVNEESLLPSIGGSDEIAELDRRFREMSENLSLARKRERAIVENAADVICSINEQGNFTAINPSCYSRWGYRQSDLLGRSIKKLLPVTDTTVSLAEHSSPESGTGPEDSAEGEHPLLSALKSQSQHNLEVLIRKKDGGFADTLWSIQWSSAEKKYYCVVHDFTEHKRAEQLRRDVVAMVSHDIRTPLTSISIGIEMLESGAKGEIADSALKQLERMSLSAKRLMRLVNDFLDFEKIQSNELRLEKRNVNLDVLVNNAFKELEAQAADAGIKLEIAECDYDFPADGERVSQILINLLSNAIKYSPRKGTVTVDASIDGAELEVRVVDEGPGIGMDEQTRIFERFKQVDGSIKANSSGLGLSICKSLVELHGGRIGVRSLPGFGSTFWFRIPLAR